MNTEELKIKAELAQGATPRSLANDPKYKASYQTIIKWRNQLREEAEQKRVDSVVDLDPVALQVVVETIEESKQKGAIDVNVQGIVEGAKGLQTLEPKFQSAAGKLLERAEELADAEDLTPTGLHTLAKAVGGLYSDIYSQKGTNVQINNNVENVSTDGMSAFEKSQR